MSTSHVNITPRNAFITGLTMAAILAAIECQAGQVVSQVQAPAGHTIWKISNPIVNQKSTEYPQIVFSAGQSVTVTADGCVQTGGSGHTWKRYVDPVGDNADTLYHGQLLIPGAMDSLQFFQARQPTVYTIPRSATLPANAHLTLGYTDAGYSDNGYSSRNSDNGNQNQCWHLGDAELTVDIAPLEAVKPIPASQNYVLTVQNVMIRNLRSAHSDTDKFGAAVTVNGTQSNVASQAVGSDWEQGPHDFSFPIEVDEVAPGDRVAFTYSIVNAGNPGDQKVDNAIVSVVQKVAGAVPTYGTIVSVAMSAWQAIYNVSSPNCDGPVVADNIMATGADLAQWTQDGPITRTMSFSGVHSPDGCGSNSFYEVTYSIARTDHVIPFSLQVNMKTKKAIAGSAAKFVGPLH